MSKFRWAAKIHKSADYTEMEFAGERIQAVKPILFKQLHFRFSKNFDKFCIG